MLLLLTIAVLILAAKFLFVLFKIWAKATLFVLFVLVALVILIIII